jgi:SAM-dependent methyltransferase
MLPLYPLVGHLDNCNFARRTLWEGAIQEGDSFRFHPKKPCGRQFIAEGANLSEIPSGTYDFVLSSHMLEHTANPLGALQEWARILRAAGTLVLIVPHRDGTFDHRRPVTTLQHLIEDFEAGRSEADRTHFSEVVELHDSARDTGEDPESFRSRVERNSDIRSVHHHVFDTRLALAAAATAGFEILTVEPLRPYHIVLIGRKANADTQTSAPNFDSILSRSPFPTDRR